MTGCAGLLHKSPTSQAGNDLKAAIAVYEAYKATLNDLHSGNPPVLNDSQYNKGVAIEREVYAGIQKAGASLIIWEEAASANQAAAQGDFNAAMASLNDALSRFGKLVNGGA